MRNFLIKAHIPGSKITRLSNRVLGKASSAKTKQIKPAFVMCVLLGFVGYQFVLCFVNTNFFPVSNELVTATEAFLLAVVAWRVYPTCSLNEVFLALCLAVYFLLLCAIRGEVDLEGPRNIFVILLAYALGRAAADREAANKVVWIISGVVLFWGGLEYFFSNTYYHFFDVLHYYIARGAVSESVQSWVQGNAYVSGMRMGGRNLFPFLGDLRVSSIFLEPVSMGNYAIIVCLWALSLGAEHKRQAIGHFLVALILIVACDSRFASILVFLMLALRFAPATQKREFIAALPVLAVSGLVAFTLAGLGDATQDNLSGRLMRSGQAIVDMDLSGFIGIGIPESLGDMGVAYTLEHFGVFLCVILWAMLAVPQLRDKRASRFRVLLAIYCLTILSISGTSFFSAKTSTLVWFLYGVLCSKKENFDEADATRNAHGKHA